MWAVLSPFPSKREGDGFLFCALKRRKFSWGQFYVMERICEFLKRHNFLIKLQPWRTFLWTSFCPYNTVECVAAKKISPKTFKLFWFSKRLNEFMILLYFLAHFLVCSESKSSVKLNDYMWIKEKRPECF